MLSAIDRPNTAPAPERKIVSYTGPRRTIVVVDDNEDHRELMREVLAPLDFVVLTAGGGPECLTLIEGVKADLFLVDISMPGMNGWQLVERLRDAGQKALQQIAESGEFKLDAIEPTASAVTATFVRNLAGEASEAYLQQIDDPAQLTLAAYADVRMQRWNDGRVLAIGDCAHAMSPQLGQGANMALVDAAALADALGNAGDEHQQALDWNTIFTRYGDTRRDHLRYYRQASRLLTPLFQSNSGSLAVLRNIALTLARHNSFGRQHAGRCTRRLALVGGAEARAARLEG
jgi:2-polyprenyl-6-methoxyphenol hydroxylase-like FAD-dependent oxidoreductase